MHRKLGIIIALHATLWVAMLHSNGGLSIASPWIIHSALLLLFCIGCIPSSDASPPNQHNALFSALALLLITAMLATQFGSMNRLGILQLLLYTDVWLWMWLLSRRQLMPTTERAFSSLLLGLGSCIAIAVLCKQRWLYNPNQMAALIALTYFFPWAFWRQQNPTSWQYRLCLGLCLLMSLALIATFSRSALFATCMVGLYALPVEFTRRYHKSSRWLVLSLIICIIVGQSFFKENRISLQTRLQGLHTLSNVLKTRPWFGSGMGSFQNQYEISAKQDTTSSALMHAHNDYLQWLIESGLVGGGLLLLCLGLWFRTLPPLTAVSPLARAARLGIYALLIHVAFDFSLQLPLILLVASLQWLLTLPNQPIGFNPNSAWHQPAPKWLYLVCGLWLLLPLYGFWQPWLRQPNYWQDQYQQQQEQPLTATVPAYQAMALAPTAANALILAKLHTQMNNRKLASTYYQTAIRLDPRNYSVQESYADFLLAGGDIMPALQIYKTMLQYYPGRTTYIIHDLIERSIDPVLLSTIIPLHYVSYRPWITFLKEHHFWPLVESEAQKAELQLFDCKLSFTGDLIESQLAQEKLDAAQSSLARYIQKCPRHSADNYLWQARIAYAQHDYTTALTTLKQLLQVTDNDAVAIRLAQMITTQQPKLNVEWLGYLDALVANDTNRPVLQRERSRILQLLGRWQEAVDISKQLISNDLNNNDYKHMLAKLYLEKKLYGPVFQLYNDMIMTTPDDPQLYLELATIYQQLQLPEQSRKTLTRGTAQLPNNPQLLEALHKSQP